MRKLSGIFIVAFILIWMPTRLQAAQDQAGKAPQSQTQAVPRAGTLFRDCPNCPEMVVIPAGTFDMGSPDSEPERDDDEGPVRKVKVSAFALGKTEITRGQFAEFVRQTRYDAGERCLTLDAGRFAERDGNWRKPGFPQDDRHPVTCVNWNDAQAYAQWLSRKTGRQYRLPTEAEWEYAARAGTRSARYWGDAPDTACRYANVTDKTAKTQIPATLAWRAHDCNDRYAYTAPAGRFKANAFGLRDMLGNVWEWTGDIYHDSYEDAPVDGNAWQGSGTSHALRGGSWNSDPQNVRAAVRNSNRAALRFSFFGFRLARKLP
ncbi:MAG: formylglycine-generating enzyme family protein [Nitrosomonadales bacterium]|nr:formylglycine-generating enzyme family protein [Nitrosomonadales bacterium]